MRTYYRIVERSNGLGDASYSLFSSYGWFGSYVIGSWCKSGDHETIDKVTKALNHNTERDLREKTVKSKVIK